jgi:solute carrier family 32 (vesicular inhibitory amino acid transporter)
MRHPHKWGHAVKVTFSFSVSTMPYLLCIVNATIKGLTLAQYVLDTCLAIIGILMFGDGISDAITSNILKTAGFPKPLTILMCIFIAIIPLTKIPLNARPLITTADVLCGIHYDHYHYHEEHHQQGNSAATRRSMLIRNSQRSAVRIVVVLVLLVISVVFPAFDSVCAFLGAALCTLISIILPISFYFKLYWKDISLTERIVSWVLLVLFSILGVLGTIWTFLPKHVVGV